MKHKLKENSFKLINNGATSTTFKAPHIFVKYIISHKSSDVYKREKYLSTILEKFDWYPRLLGFDDDNEILIYRYIGLPVTKENKPNDIKKQFDKILVDLNSVNIQHNDIKEGEIIMDEKGKIYLCDFGWGTVNKRLDCGINISNRTKPGGMRDDASTLKRLGFV